MQIVNVLQGSPEWDKLREKRMTASHATAIGNCGKGLISYINELMWNYYALNPPERFANKHTERGNDLEDSASFAYCAQENVFSKKVGFVIKDDFVGVSPDLFVDLNGLAEIKCRDRKAYWEFLNTKKLQPAEIWQANMQMLVCGKEWTDIVYYNPEFKIDILVERIFPDQKKVDALEKGFAIGREMIEELTEKWEKLLK